MSNGEVLREQKVQPCLSAGQKESPEMEVHEPTECDSGNSTGAGRYCIEAILCIHCGAEARFEDYGTFRCLDWTCPRCGKMVLRIGTKAGGDLNV